MKQLLSRILLHYFRLLAKLQLKKIRPRIIGITGSAGKSSTMEAIAAILQEKYRCKVGRKANSESGIPLNILDLEPGNFSLFDWLRLAALAPLQLLTNWKRYDWYIVEMGIDSPFPPKNMGYLLTILSPEIGVFTSVDAVHSETFDPLVTGDTPEARRNSLVREIAKEKGRLTTTLPTHGLAVLNGDQDVLMTEATPTAATIMTFGHEKTATVHVASVEWTADSTRCIFVTDEEKVTLTIPGYLLPKHFGNTFAAALCVALHTGISPYLACKYLEKNFTLPPGRATLLPAINDAQILDSSYNASLQPMCDTLEIMQRYTAGRRLALLGDMRELGSVTQRDHEAVATEILHSLDAVFLVGPYMRQYVMPILERAHFPAQWFPSAQAAIPTLQKTLQAHDILLVKGSQNTLLLEIAIAALLADPADAAHLCRRGAFWDAQRAKLQ